MPSYASLPLVTIGMPVFNSERHLRTSLESAVAQDYPNLEILVSDNASTDSTPQIVREYARSDKRIRYWRNPTNLGVVKNFGLVLRESRGKYFTWLASDDYLSCPQSMSKSVAFLESNPDVILCGSDVHILDLLGPGLLMPQRFHEIYPDQSAQNVRHCFYTWPQSMICFAIYGVYRRDALTRVSFAGRKYRGRNVVTHMEWPILLPLLESGRIVALPEFLRVYRSNADSSWFRESSRLTGLEQFILGLQMKSYLCKMAWRLTLPRREKFQILWRTVRNFLDINLRTEHGEAVRLQRATQERRNAVALIRSEISKRVELLRQQGRAIPDELVDAIATGNSESAWEPRKQSRWRVPGWFAPIWDTAFSLMTDYFRRRSAAQQVKWRREIKETWALRSQCDELLEEIHRLSAIAERCLQLIHSPRDAALENRAA